MPRIAPDRRKRSVRAFSFDVEVLEGRQLLSVDVSTPASATDLPLAIGRLVAAPTKAQLSSALLTDSPATSPGSAVSAPYTPAQIRHAYGVDQLSEDGTGQTIAIVDAYSAPTIASDLAAFDNYFSLPTANLVIANPNGVTPPSNSGWDLEISLDVEWAHAMAPGAKILLVEATSDSSTDLYNAVGYAVAQGASQVSMSWGGGDGPGESSEDSLFDHPGVTFLASSGDTGAEVIYPSSSPYVTAVGGTTISLDAAGDKLSESAWSDGGGGISTGESEPSFQNGFLAATGRGTPDVAFDADPASGVFVYESGNFYDVGGTSVGAPAWSGLIALANEGRANAGEAPLGTGQAYGTNTVLYQLAGGTSYTNPNADFYDVTTGSNGNPATTGYDLATGLGSPVVNKLIPGLIGTPATTLPTIGDAGFEQVQVGAGKYKYDPTGSAWTFSGSAGNGSGLTGNNSGFTNGNPAAPQGTQVAFLQEKGSITQSVAGWSAGSYTISFDAAQRANFGTSVEDFEVLVDGKVVSTFKPTTTSYQIYTTASFTVTAGAHTIEFLGLDTAGGDNTAFLDAVSVATATATPPTVPSVGDSGFESVAVGSGYSYNPTGSAWTFSSSSGVSGNGSGFTSGNPAAPQGTQVAFLQEKGSITQSVAGWSAGSYTISFDAAQRANFGTSVEDFEVLVDGKVVSTFKPTTTSYQIYTTASFTVTAGAHTIEFLGLDTAGGDNTAFLDAVSVATATATPPTVPSVGDSGFESVAVGSGYSYNPTGSAWTFSGSAGNGSGVAGNNSGFTNGNPAAPQGTQVAFLQEKGSITQSVAGWSAGSYTISFDAAQRANFGTSVEDFEVLVDGKVVSTFKPTTTSYQIYTTASFTVTAGAHTIEFLGLDTAGGDNTAFLDAVTIATA